MGIAEEVLPCAHPTEYQQAPPVVVHTVAVPRGGPQPLVAIASHLGPRDSTERGAGHHHPGVVEVLMGIVLPFEAR